MDNKIRWLEPVGAPPLTCPDLNTEIGPGILTLNTPLHTAVFTAKNDIDRLAPPGSWDDAKKITNPFEYIFLSLQRRMHKSMAAVQPLSRSFFKMVEIWDLLGLEPTSIRGTAHAAEGPGGFLEAVLNRTGAEIPMVAMTLRSTERTIPGWRKSQAFMGRHPQIHITYGADDTGNLYSIPNQIAFEVAVRTELPGSTADLFTADGGFDFSADFNGQENTVQRLLMAEALAGISTLRPGTGTMVLKLFDTKNRATLELMWLLGWCFERTGIVKPHTSRPANSERYWVGVGFRTPPHWLKALLMRLTDQDAPNGWNQIFAEPPWTPTWLHEVQAFQEELEEQQQSKIQLTLNLIRSPTADQVRILLYENIVCSRAWCAIHNIPLNPAYAGLSDDQIVALNLEEALAPFQALVGRMSLPAMFRQPPTHRVLSAPRPPRPPTVPAWRSALPESVLGRSPSQTIGGTPPSRPPALSQSVRLTNPAPVPHGPHPPVDGHELSDD